MNNDRVRIRLAFFAMEMFYISVMLENRANRFYAFLTTLSNLLINQGIKNSDLERHDPYNDSYYQNSVRQISIPFLQL